MFFADGIFPQLLQVIKLALVGLEDVYYDIHVVHEGPLLAILGMIRPLAALVPDNFFDIVCNCLHLSGRLNLTKDEIVCHGLRNFSKIKGKYAFTFFVLNRLQDILK